MYKTIYVPVDNSDYSNQAIDSAIRLGEKFDSELVGCHVYAAKMHDYRFKQMEFTLPDEYLDETELDRQRKIHDSLITMGLKLISDSYLDSMQKQCKAAGLKFRPKMMDGKHHVEIVKDIRESHYDLTVLGVMGIGRVRDSQIGSVCERVARDGSGDVWVVKQLLGDEPEAERDTILVGIDGSPQSFGALMTAIELAKRFDKKVEAISVYDPYLHYSVFNGVVNVLTEKAAKVFRFEEQNQLHEEIIDCGLAQIYQSHLDVAHSMAGDQDVELERTLLDGKAFQKVLDHVRKTNPWLLVVGRIGVHSDKDAQGLGSNTENLLRACPCDVLLTSRLEYPELDLKAEEGIRWTPEAEERMKRVPPMVAGIARTAIYRLAIEQGHSVISSDLLDDAMDRYMPKFTAGKTEQLAEALAMEVARTRPTSICKSCGVTAAEPDPVKCAICGGKAFEVITEEMLEKIAAMEGGLEVETTYDGRKLKWSHDAKRALWTMKDAYKRRRAKARVEKTARIRRLSTVTLEFARQVIEDEAGIPLELPAETEAEFQPQPGNGDNGDLKLVGRDAKRNPLFSALEWTGEAAERLFRVPAGYMRDKTQQRTEALAKERAVASIDEGLVEEGIEVGRQLMEELLGSGAGSADGQRRDNGDSKKAECPFSTADGQSEGAGTGDLYLNEAGLMSAMARKRKQLPKN